MTGRPSLYKPAYCEELIQFLAEGYSITAFAGEIGVGRRTVFDWLEKHKEFAEAYEIAKPKAVLHWERAFKEFATSGKGNAAAFIFALKNRAGDDWNDKVVNEHTGKDGGPIETVNLTHAERVKALAALMAKAKPAT